MSRKWRTLKERSDQIQRDCDDFAGQMRLVESTEEGRCYTFPVLSPDGWWGGANGGCDPSGEWYATGGHTFELRLTDWPRLRESYGPFAWGPIEDCPVVVKAKLSCSGRYGASVSINVDQHHWKNVANWKGPVSVASAKRRALAFLYDHHHELVREALKAFWAGEVHGPRSLIVDESGSPIASFPSQGDAFNSKLLPQRFYCWRRDRRDNAMSGYEIERSGSSTSGRGGPDITARVQRLLTAAADSETDSW